MTYDQLVSSYSDAKVAHALFFYKPKETFAYLVRPDLLQGRVQLTFKLLKVVNV